MKIAEIKCTDKQVADKTVADLFEKGISDDSCVVQTADNVIRVYTELNNGIKKK